MLIGLFARWMGRNRLEDIDADADGSDEET
jgi:hypothetical protein